MNYLLAFFDKVSEYRRIKADAPKWVRMVDRLQQAFSVAVTLTVAVWGIPAGMKWHQEMIVRQVINDDLRYGGSPYHCESVVLDSIFETTYQGLARFDNGSVTKITATQDGGVANGTIRVQYTTSPVQPISPAPGQ